MKKYSLIFLVSLLTVSCGVQLEDTNERMESTIGEIRVYMEKNFQANDLTTLSNMCNALAVKESYYAEEFVDRNTSLHFNNSEKKCDQTEAQINEVSLKLKNVYGKIEFVNEAGSTERFFSDYETRTNGTIAELCRDLASGIVKSVRKLTGAAFADWYHISNSATTCGARDSICLIKERGYEVSSGRFEITRAEKIVVSTKARSLELGVVIHRELAEKCESSRDVSIFSSTRKF